MIIYNVQIHEEEENYKHFGPYLQYTISWKIKIKEKIDQVCFGSKI